MPSIIERILEGTVCRSEVSYHNASILLAWIKDTDSHHTKEDCERGKDCVHAPGEMTIEWAVATTSEAVHLCTCGEHGNDNPEAAAEVIAGFRERWGGDTPPPTIHRKKGS